MIHFIIATHGPLATAFLQSSRMVYGELENVYAVTLSEGDGIEGFKRDFAAVLERASQGADGVLVLCDMQSGTPWNVASHSAFTPDAPIPVAVIGGVNFPMLLQTDDVARFSDVNAAAAHLLALTVPTLVKAVPVTTAQSDDF
ncbi:PTS sugar transporter subunit IIA [Phytobacter sp. V91]|uniref:PTS sugar transporter subunit IIA n=1 Tax=Phytobacter sp. V91 TaxID=3369425 RepID=UPI003F64776E